mmetsp:Transcript_21339/g.48049  ORF Transcript_21339/g.48049 Transcript_21339/m.48049 type:complete len:228 (+) Transcript_21339:64-747(+)
MGMRNMEHKVRIHAMIHPQGRALGSPASASLASHKRRVQIMRRNLTRDPWHPLPWHTFRVVPGQTRRDLTRIADHSRLLAHCCDLMRIADHSRLLAQCVPATMRPCAHASLLGSSLAHPQRIPRSLLAASSLIQGTSSHPCIAQASSFLHPGLHVRLQQPDHVPMPALLRNVERVVLLPVLLAVDGMHVCTTLKQQPHNLEVAILCREDQGAHAGRLALVDVCRAIQ